VQPTKLKGETLSTPLRPGLAMLHEQQAAAAAAAAAPATSHPSDAGALALQPGYMLMDGNYSDFGGVDCQAQISTGVASDMFTSSKDPSGPLDAPEFGGQTWIGERPPLRFGGRRFGARLRVCSAPLRFSFAARPLLTAYPEHTHLKPPPTPKPLNP